MSEVKSLAAELVAVQSELPKPQKNAKGNFGRYTDITEILTVLRPVLNRHGFFLGQKIKQAEGGLLVETFVLHTSGESLSFGEMFMPASPNKGGNLVQGYGIAETYARRYALCAAFGLEADDDDAQSLSNAQPAQSAVPGFTDKQLADAEASATEGLSAYQAYFAGLTKAQRQALTKAGVHERLKAVASKAGA